MDGGMDGPKNPILVHSGPKTTQNRCPPSPAPVNWADGKSSCHSACQVQKHLNGTSAETWHIGGTLAQAYLPSSMLKTPKEKTGRRKELLRWGTSQGHPYCHTLHGTFTPNNKLLRAIFNRVIWELSGTLACSDPGKAHSPEWRPCPLKSENHGDLGSSLLQWPWDAPRK